MSDKDELSRSVLKIFSDEELEVDLNDDVHGKIYATNGFEVHIFIPKELIYIQLHVEMGVITDEDVCALPLYCMSENIRDECWPRRVFGIDPDRRVILYAQLFPVTINSNFRLKDATEGLAHAAQRHKHEISALISNIDNSAPDEASRFSEDVIFRA